MGRKKRLPLDYFFCFARYQIFGDRWATFWREKLGVFFTKKQSAQMVFGEKL
jgi:hypothetical protein